MNAALALDTQLRAVEERTEDESIGLLLMLVVDVEDADSLWSESRISRRT